MKDSFREIGCETISENAFKLIGRDWMLITAGPLAGYNTMTASWGGMGVLWNKNVCFCFIRPQRHTRQFVEKTTDFSLTFFDGEHRMALEFCGSHSGRDTDKAKETGLKVLEIAPGIIGFAQARLIVGCRKIYAQDIDPALFIDPAIMDNYPERDFHRMYIGEVTGAWIRG